MITANLKQRLGSELFEMINGSGWLHQSPYEQRRWIRAAVDIYIQGLNQNIAQEVDARTN